MAAPVDDALLAQLYTHAREAFPEECCGYIVGATVVRCRNAQADGVHPTHPGRGAETGFVIAGRELFDFARTFSTGSPARVVYHSHTNGRAYFSEVDRRNALGDGAPVYPVDHVVVGVTDRGVTEAAQYAWSSDAGDFVEVARWNAGC